MKVFFLNVAMVFCAGISPAQDFVKVAGSEVNNYTGASRSVNWIDYDNDNDLDLFITTGLQAGDDNLLYRNDNGTFIRILNQPLVHDLLPSDGSSWADYDNDGLPDLCVVNWYNKIKLLYHNEGAGYFTFQSSAVMCNDPSYSETCTWGDYDNDGFADLFVTNSAGSGHRNFLYKNVNGSGFVKIDTGVVVNETAFSRGANWADIDNDRDLDLFVCREGNQNDFLYKNNGGGYFTKVTNSPLTTSGGESWSCSWGDYDNDGDLDAVVANHLNQKNFLFRNEGNFTFTKITNDPLSNENGYNAVTGWGDYDNDGDLDMFVSQAYVPPNFTIKLVNKLYKNMLIETGAAMFQKITSGELVNDSGYTYGFAWGDYDNDGDLDIACANTFGENQNNALYRNDLNNGNKWISIRCSGTVSNSSAIGAKVYIKASINGNVIRQMQEVDGQSGYCGQNLILHFGLGNASVIDSLKVEWPSGVNQIFANVAVNQNVRIIENGTLISVGEKKTEVDQDFILNQNYPNPFNPSTTIEYQVRKPSHVFIAVYNASGVLIRNLVNGFHIAGTYETVFDAGRGAQGSNFSSGVYFYKIVAGNFAEARRMLLIK